MTYSEHERQSLTKKITEEIKGLAPENIEFLIDMIESEFNSGFECGYDAGHSEGYSEGHYDAEFDRENNE